MSGLAEAITELVKTADAGFGKAIAQHSGGNHTTAGNLRNTALDAVEAARVLLLTVANPTKTETTKNGGDDA